jgi:hypothetical protein
MSPPPGFTKVKPADGGSTLPPGFTKVKPGSSRLKEVAEKSMFQLPDTSAPDYWSGVAERGKGLARAGIEGATFGLAGLGAAYLNSWLKDEPYQQAWDEQQQMRKDAAAKLDAVNPGTYSAVEFGGSLANPAVAGKLLAPGAGMLKSGLAYGAEGAVKGGVNAYGHGGSAEDIAEGAVLGGGSGALGGAFAAPFSKWWSGGTRAAPPPPAPRTLQEVFQPAPPPSAPTSKVANAVESWGNAPKLTTMAADTGLAALGLPPLATTTSTWAQTLAPAVKNYLTKGADGRLLVNPQAAQAAREVLARLAIGSGAQRGGQ